VATATRASKARLEARIDAELDGLITQAADRLNVTKTAFVTESLRDAALKVVARDEATPMPAEVFDAMMASIDVADESRELAALAKLPRRISR
jgi:uncharacterized protein (DUF1778 family)